MTVRTTKGWMWWYVAMAVIAWGIFVGFVFTARHFGADTGVWDLSVAFVLYGAGIHWGARLYVGKRLDEEEKPRTIKLFEYRWYEPGDEPAIDNDNQEVTPEIDQATRVYMANAHRSIREDPSLLEAGQRLRHLVYWEAYGPKDGRTVCRRTAVATLKMPKWSRGGRS